MWGSEQSNSVGGLESRGVLGSYLWIWDSEDIEAQLAGDGDAQPIACGPSGGTGPCDMLHVFPQDLMEMDADGMATGNTLGDLYGLRAQRRPRRRRGHQGVGIGLGRSPCAG